MPKRQRSAHDESHNRSSSCARAKTELAILPAEAITIFMSLCRQASPTTRADPDRASGAGGLISKKQPVQSLRLPCHAIQTEQRRRCYGRWCHPSLSERVHVTACGLSKCKALVGPMQVVVDVEWLVRICSAPNTLGRLIQNARDRELKISFRSFRIGFRQSRPLRSTDKWSKSSIGPPALPVRTDVSASRCSAFARSVYYQTHGPISLD